MCSCRCGVSVGEGESKIFLCCHLNWNYIILLFSMFLPFRSLGEIFSDPATLVGLGMVCVNVFT